MFVDPRRNQISSWAIALNATCFVVTRGNPSFRSNRIWRPKTLRCVDFLARRAEDGPRRLPVSVESNFAKQIQELPHTTLSEPGDDSSVESGAFPSSHPSLS